MTLNYLRRFQIKVENSNQGFNDEQTMKSMYKSLQKKEKTMESVFNQCGRSLINYMHLFRYQIPKDRSGNQWTQLQCKPSKFP
jgi:hypothetical protein